LASGLDEEPEAEEVLAAALEGVGMSSVLDSDRERDAATMMGGVDSNADEKSPDRLRNRPVIVI